VEAWWGGSTLFQQKAKIAKSNKEGGGWQTGGRWGFNSPHGKFVWSVDGEGGRTNNDIWGTGMVTRGKRRKTFSEFERSGERYYDTGIMQESQNRAYQRG